MITQWSVASMNQRRIGKPTGSVIVLLAALLTLLIAVLIGVFNLVDIFVVHHKATENADQCALHLVEIFNRNNVACRMNNSLSRARQLVFLSRTTLNEVQITNHSYLQPLAAHLMDQSRSGAQIVITQQQRLCAAQLLELRKEIDSMRKEQDSSAIDLPWLHATGSQIEAVELGSIQDSQANNTYDVEQWPDLVEADKQAKLIEPQTRLYRGGINAVLPGEDADLQFKLSKLAPMVDGWQHAAWLIKPGLFTKELDIVKNDEDQICRINQIPSALQLTLRHGISTPLLYGHKQSLEVKTTSAACGNGASEPLALIKEENKQ
jgi:hypothetical protein